ncbi:MAG: type II secretion system protein [Planctomycetota bacterium]
MNQYRGNRGFTLVELLVVVAIITVLVSVLLPTLARAVDAARTVTCASQMRQIGTASVGYSTDNDGFVVFAAWEYEGKEWGFDDMLSPYAGKDLSKAEIDSGNRFDTADQWANLADIWQCPDDPFDDSPTRFTYRMPSHNNNTTTGKRGSRPGIGISNTRWPDDGWRTLEQWRYAQLPDAAGTLLLAEKIAKSGEDGLGRLRGKTIRRVRDMLRIDDPWTRELHDGRMNWAFVDGSVRRLEPIETVGDGDPERLNPAGRMDSDGMWTVLAND